MRSAIALLVLLAPAAAGAQSLRTEDLIGRWGVAAYWNESDASRIMGMARGFCNQPYIVSRGANGAARMFEAFEGRPQDVLVQGNRIVAVGGSNRTAKAIQRWDGNTLVMNYIDEEAKRKYGNMVFVRCAR